MRISRRRLLGGGLAGVGVVAGTGALVETDVLPGRAWAHRRLGLDGGSGVIPDVTPGRIRRGTLDGADWLVCEPPGGGAGLPVVLAFHGGSFDAPSLVSRFGVDRFLAASRQRFVVAAITGGSTFWHPRADGTDAMALALDRFVPHLTRLGYAADRPGLLGWSMGGYGALYAATVLGRRAAAVAVSSPALWSRWDSGLTGIFDDEADFDAHGMFARAALLRGTPVSIDCGREDPFYEAVEAFADRLAEVDVPARVSIEPGAHTIAYWTRVLPGQLTWLGRQVPAA